MNIVCWRELLACKVRLSTGCVVRGGSGRHEEMRKRTRKRVEEGEEWKGVTSGMTDEANLKLECRRAAVAKAKWIGMGSGGVGRRITTG